MKNEAKFTNNQKFPPASLDCLFFFPLFYLEKNYVATEKNEKLYSRAKTH